MSQAELQVEVQRAHMREQRKQQMRATFFTVLERQHEKDSDVKALAARKRKLEKEEDDLQLRLIEIGEERKDLCDELAKRLEKHLPPELQEKKK